MRYFSRHLYLCLQSTHLSITIELNNVDSSGLVFFWACILLGLYSSGLVFFWACSTGVQTCHSLETDAGLASLEGACGLRQPTSPLPLTLDPKCPRRPAPG